MFDELRDYRADHFFFEAQNDLAEVCNAPADRSGIYLVYAAKNGRMELVYIGRSGRGLPNGNVNHVTKGLGGLKETIVNGKDSNKLPRKQSWVQRMKDEHLEFLDVYWYVTFDTYNCDYPENVEKRMLNLCKRMYGNKPKWNLI